MKTLFIPESNAAWLKSLDGYHIFYVPRGYIFVDTSGTVYTLADSTFAGFSKSKKTRFFTDSSKLYPAGDSILVYSKLKQEGVMVFLKNDSLHFSPNTLTYHYPSPPDYYNMNRNEVKMVNFNHHYCFLFNYGLNERGRNINFLDSTAFFYLTPDSATHKLGKYPSYYFHQYLPIRPSCFTTDNTGAIYYTHSFTDSIYKMDANGNILARSLIQCYVTPSYTEKDLTNLTYLRQYISAAEYNVSLLNVGAKYLVLLRKLEQPAIINPIRYQFYVYNTSLQLQFTDTIRASISPKLFPTKHGFFVFTDHVDKLIEYEIE